MGSYAGGRSKERVLGATASEKALSHRRHSEGQESFKARWRNSFLGKGKEADMKRRESAMSINRALGSARESDVLWQQAQKMKSM